MLNWTNGFEMLWLLSIVKPYGEVIRSPYEVAHTINELRELAALLLHLDEKVKVVMEPPNGN